MDFPSVDSFELSKGGSIMGDIGATVAEVVATLAVVFD